MSHSARGPCRSWGLHCETYIGPPRDGTGMPGAIVKRGDSVTLGTLEREDIEF